MESNNRFLKFESNVCCYPLVQVRYLLIFITRKELKDNAVKTTKINRMIQLILILFLDLQRDHVDYKDHVHLIYVGCDNQRLGNQNGFLVVRHRFDKRHQLKNDNIRQVNCSKSSGHLQNFFYFEKKIVLNLDELSVRVFRGILNH